MASALTITGPVPVDERVMVCVVAEFTFSFPKLRLDELTLNVSTEFSCNANVWLALPADAISVTTVALLTVFTVAVKPALLDPAVTVTEAGTETSVVLLLERFTTKPPVAAAVSRVTVQLSVPAPVNVPLVQVSPVSTGTPAPLKATVAVVPVDELLFRVSEPETAPAAVGSNCTVSVAV
jgi:hypothetical protein